MLSKIFNAIFSLLQTKIYTNVYTILIVIGIYLYWNYSIQEAKEETTSNVLSYLDSIENKNKILFSKIDSLDLNKKEKLTIYHTTTLKYDTIKILIDSMPPLDATLFLLSKSRHLTSKGIE